MSDLHKQNFQSQQYQLNNYEQIIAPSIYPKWASAYKRLTTDSQPKPFYLKPHQWANRLSALTLQAKKRLLWALDLPPLDEAHRHLILYALQYSKDQNIAFVAYFNKMKHATPYLTKLNEGDDAVLDLFESSSFHLPFLLVDQLLVFERPSLGHHQDRCLYFIEKINDAQLKWLLSLPALHLSDEEQQSFITAI